MKTIILITSDNEEIETNSTTKQLINSINTIENSNNDKYNINIDSQYIDFLLDYVEWVEINLETFNNIQYRFKEIADVDYLKEIIEVTKELGVMGLQEQITKYIELLLLRNNKYYSLQEVMEHQKSNDYWMILDNCIYDVTSWIDKHPGGDTILSGLNRDCAFYFEIYHKTDESFKKLNKYFIGYLNNQDLINVPHRFYNNNNSNSDNNNNNNNKNSEIPSNEFWVRLNKLCPQQQTNKQ